MVAPSAERRLPAPASLAAWTALIFGSAVLRVAYAMATRSTGQAHFAVFWVAYLAALIGVAWVGHLTTTSNRTRWLLLCAWGLYTFLPKMLMSRSGPNYFDEFGHYRHLRDIVSHHSLDVADSYLPIIKYYPGLEVLTAGVHYVTRLSLWHSGQLVVAVAHIVALVAVWRLAVALRIDPRWGYLAAVVYSLNPNFAYFDTEYSYESLGLPLAVVAVTFLVLARRSRTAQKAIAWSAAALVTGGTTIFTHHVSAAVMSAVMLAVALVMPVERTGGTNRWSTACPWVVAVVVSAAYTLWVTTVARSTVSYLLPHLQVGVDEVGDLITGQKQAPTSSSQLTSPRHQLFGASGIPFYEIICGFLAPVVAFGAVVGSLFQAWYEREYRDRLRRNAPFLLLGLTYFASLPLALTSGGGETAHRIWSFSYVGIAICVVAGHDFWRRLWLRLGVPGTALGAAGLLLLVVVAVGNIASGEDVYYRFPGPYVFGTDTRSSTPELFQVAAWAQDHIPPGTNVVTDRDTGEVIAGYTDLNVPGPGNSTVYALYLEGDLATEGVRHYLAQHDFRYWILDTRIGTDKPQEKLFETYYGPQSVSRSAVGGAGHSSFLRIVHRTKHYEVLAIHP